MNNALNATENYINLLDSELVIRKKELHAIKEIIDSSDNFFIKFILLRNTLPAIYAHYEGFLKYSFVELVNTLKEEHLENANHNFLAFFLISKLENHLVKQSSKSKIIRNTIKEYFSDSTQKDNLSIDKYIINHDTLEETCALLGIDPNNLTSFNIKKNIPIKKLNLLYTKRNTIAHGDLQTNNQFSFSTKKDITESQVTYVYASWLDDYNTVLDCLDTIKDLFVTYLLTTKGNRS